MSDLYDAILCGVAMRILLLLGAAFAIGVGGDELIRLLIRHLHVIWR